LLKIGVAAMVDSILVLTPFPYKMNLHYISSFFTPEVRKYNHEPTHRQPGLGDHFQPGSASGYIVGQVHRRE
jgi:hypothetical protein